MGGILLSSEEESKLAGSWAILGLEMPIERKLIDRVKLRKNAYHSFLALVDYTDPKNPEVSDEIHFGPRSKSGKSIASRIMSEAIGRMGDLHMSKTFKDVSKVTGLSDKLHFLKDLHYVSPHRNDELPQIPKATYFQDYKTATNEVWKDFVSISEDIGKQDIMFINGMVNCRTGIKAVIEVMGAEFITVIDDPSVYVGQDNSSFILDHLEGVAICAPYEIKTNDPIVAESLER